jgi:hypothetical protein
MEFKYNKDQWMLNKKLINDLMNISLGDKDYTFWELGQWFGCFGCFNYILVDWYGCSCNTII